MNEREKLIKYWRVDEYNPAMTTEFAIAIADFIIADRRRIVSPIVAYKNLCGESGFKWPEGMCDIAIEESIKLAALEVDNG